MQVSTRGCPVIGTMSPSRFEAFLVELAELARRRPMASPVVLSLIGQLVTNITKSCSASPQQLPLRAVLPVGYLD